MVVVPCVCNPILSHYLLSHRLPPLSQYPVLPVLVCESSWYLLVLPVDLVCRTFPLPNRTLLLREVVGPLQVTPFAPQIVPILRVLLYVPPHLDTQTYLVSLVRVQRVLSLTYVLVLLVFLLRRLEEDETFRVVRLGPLNPHQEVVPHVQ